MHCRICICYRKINRIHLSANIFQRLETEIPFLSYRPVILLPVLPLPLMGRSQDRLWIVLISVKPDFIGGASSLQPSVLRLRSFPACLQPAASSSPLLFCIAPLLSFHRLWHIHESPVLSHWRYKGKLCSWMKKSDFHLWKSVFLHNKSARRGSNPRPQPWQG